MGREEVVEEGVKQLDKEKSVFVCEKKQRNIQSDTNPEEREKRGRDSFLSPRADTDGQRG